MTLQTGEDLVEEVLELGGSLAVYNGGGTLIACFGANIGRKVLRGVVKRYHEHTTHRLGRIPRSPAAVLLEPVGN